MKLLLDTSIFIKILDDSPQLSKVHREAIADPANEKWISLFSFMELVIKIKIGKLPQITLSPIDILKQSLDNGFLLLPLSTHHVFAYQQLPLMEEHRDPFDRFIISTALVEQMTILTTDSKFSLYSDFVRVIRILPSPTRWIGAGVRC